MHRDRGVGPAGAGGRNGGFAAAAAADCGTDRFGGVGRTGGRERDGFGASAVRFAAALHQDEVLEEHANAVGEELADVGEKCEEDGDADDGVGDGDDFADIRVAEHVTITCLEKGNTF